MASSTGGVYFPVDTSFCETQAARQVIRRFGADGFLAYVRLLCMMLREDGGRLSVALDDDWEDIAYQLGIDTDAAQELVGVLVHYGALVMDAGHVWCPLVSESIAKREERSARGRRAAHEKWKREHAEKQDA